MAITVTDTGYIKRTPISTYRNQRRGGKGRIGMRTRDEDVVNHLFVASTHSYMMIFTDRGRVYWLKVHEIPDVGADGRGKSIANLVQMEAGEKIAAMVAVREFDDGHHVVMGTRQGTIKKTELSAFANPRAGGIIAMGIDDGDEVIAVQVSDGASQIFIGSRDGMAIRFPEDDVRPMGRTAYGVRGISLREGDEVVAMEVVKPGGTLLTVTELGYGKRTPLDEYRVQSRGGLGLKNVEITEKNGKVIADCPGGGRRERVAAHHRAGQDPADADRGHPYHRPGHAGRPADGPRGGRQTGVGGAGRQVRRAAAGRSGAGSTGADARGLTWRSAADAAQEGRA